MLNTFRNQIANGGPVTVTDPAVTRYFMTVGEAVHLVLQAAAIGDPAETLVLDMGDPVRICDVAEQMIQRSGREVAIEFTGLRPGEKLDEVLLSSSEEQRASSHPKIVCTRVSAIQLDDAVAYANQQLSGPEVTNT